MSVIITKSVLSISGLTIGEFLSENVSKPLEARVFIGEENIFVMDDHDK